jgi:hypothetical protein
MSKLLQSILIGGTSLTVAALFAFAAGDTPTKFAAIDQNIDQATLSRMHYADQRPRPNRIATSISRLLAVTGRAP